MGLKAIYTRFVVVALATLGSTHAFAREGDIVVNIVAADTQRPLAAVQVEATGRDGEAYQALSDQTGRALVSRVPSGLYEVLVSHASHQSLRLPSVRVVNGKATALRVELQILRGRLEETFVIGESMQMDRAGSVGTSFIDREALRSAAGSGSDVLRALDGLPGLFSSGEFASFTVRGNGPRDNLIFVDGVPFANVVHFEDSFGEQEDVEGGGRFSVFAPNLISGAEFQPGGWSAAYGGPAGSLLKLQVAEGNRDTPSYTTRIDLAGVEVGYDGPSRIGADTSLLFSARRLDFGRVFDTIGEEDIGTPILTDVIVKTSSQLSDRDKLNILAIYAPEEYERDVDNVLASDEDDPGNFEDTELARIDRDNLLFAVHWSRLVGDNGELNNRIYYRYFDESSSTGEAFPDLVPPDTPASEIPLREDIIIASTEETEVGWRLDYSTINRFGKFALGLRATQTDYSYDIALDDDWIRYVYDGNDFRPDPEQKYIVLTPESVDNRYDESASNIAFYSEQLFEFEQWDFRIGGRFDRDALAEESLFSPRLGATWQASLQLEFSATAGVYYQAPNVDDRARDESNSDLENEQINQISLGLKYFFQPDLSLLVEPYYQQLDNLVVDEDNVNQTLSNAGEGRSFGVDTALIRKFADGWSAYVNYSYNDARVKDAAELPYYDADFSRPHSVSIGGVWELSDRWKISARWKWASGVPRDEFIVNENVLGDGQPLRFSKEIVSFNTDRFESFSSLNFRLDYQRTFGATSVIAFLDVLNAYGADNPGSADFNERSGEDVVEDGSPLPLVGLRFEW